MAVKEELLHAILKEPLAQVIVRAEDKDGRQFYNALVETLLKFTDMLERNAYKDGAYDVLQEARSGIVGQGKIPIEVFDKISKRLAE